MKRRIIIVFLTVLFMMLSIQTAVLAASAALKGIRIGDDLTRTRVVLDLTANGQYAASTAQDGKQIRITMFDTSAAGAVVPAVQGSALKGITLSADNDGCVVVLDLKEAMTYNALAMSDPPRLVIDIAKSYERVKSTAKAEGLTLTEYMRSDARGILKAYIVEADQAKYALRLALAGGNISAGNKSLSHIARVSNALAAVNGGAFSYKGNLMGVTRIDGSAAGADSSQHTAMGIMKDGSLCFDTVQYQGYVRLGSMEPMSFSGVNTDRVKDSLILYNHLYGPSTGTNAFGTELVIKNGIVEEVVKGGNAEIPYNGVVVSAHGKAEEALKNIKAGDQADISEYYSSKKLDEAQIIAGAGPCVVTDNKINVTAEQEGFDKRMAEERMPRTAAGVMANGHYLLMVIDGKNSDSIGATLKETAELLRKFGAVNGYNLDGGASSEMVIGGQVINCPSSGAEHEIGSALVVKYR